MKMINIILIVLGLVIINGCANDEYFINTNIMGGSSNSTGNVSSLWNQSGSDIYYNNGDVGSGNVGIGNIPGERLDISGNLQFTSIPRPDTPTATLVSGGTLDIGTHRYYVKFYTADGYQTINSIATTPITTTAGNQAIQLTNIPVSDDSRVTKRKIYRGVDSYNGLIATIHNNVDTELLDDGLVRDNTDRGGVSPDTTSGIIFQNEQKIMQVNNNNLFLGSRAGENAPNGAYYNVFLGPSAGYSFSSTAGRNVIIGFMAGGSATSIKDSVAIGSSALQNAGSVGNIGIGYNAGLRLTTGNSNTFIGYYSGASSSTQVGTVSNTLALGSGTYTNTSNQYVYGNDDVTEHIFRSGDIKITDNLGIGTTDPQHKLEVIGNANISGTVYYGALEANSPHALLADNDLNYTRICKQATDGTVLMEKIEWNNINNEYELKYYTNQEECNKWIVKNVNEYSEYGTINNEPKEIKIKELIFEEIWTKETYSQIEQAILEIPNYNLDTYYNVGDLFKYPIDSDTIYEVIQEHAPQINWVPGETPALYKIKIFTEYGQITNWVQPQGSHDCYPIGAIVSYNNELWESIVNCNVWQPGVYGWVLI